MAEIVGPTVVAFQRRLTLKEIEGAILVIQEGGLGDKTPYLKAERIASYVTKSELVPLPLLREYGREDVHRRVRFWAQRDIESAALRRKRARRSRKRAA